MNIEKYILLGLLAQETNLPKAYLKNLIKLKLIPSLNVIYRLRFYIATDLLYSRPDDAISQIITYAARYNFHEFAIESKNFQQPMADNRGKKVLTMTGRYLRIRRLQSGAHKQSRILAHIF
jgi:hypothetical protein